MSHMKSNSRNQLVTAIIFAAATMSAPVQTSGQDIALSNVTIQELNTAFEAGTITSERLVELYINRINTYDKRGPTINAVITLNQKAIETARALDQERRASGPRSALHGIPVLLKDNIDTFDMPTTAGSVLLKGSIPNDDAFIVKRLRDAGAIILGKLNMSEFASGGAMSSLGGAIRNPHDLARSPSGSSGGTGASIAAWFAQLGIGTDTGGSIRGPSTSNGIVGLKPTHGLVSRDGVIPLALSFDTAGPMARSVYDVAAMLNALTGIDPSDDATRKSDGHIAADYTQFLDANALTGARIGVARQVLGQDGDVDWVMNAALDAMRSAGATVIDVTFPQWLLEAKGVWYTTIRWREFRDQIPDYLATIGPEYPKTLAEIVERTMQFTSPTQDGANPNPPRWNLMQREDESGDVTDYEYTAMRDHGLPLVRAIVEGVMASDNLDAIVYPTSSRRPSLVSGAGGGGGGPSAINFANLTGFPDLIVPAGFTGDRLPVGISFLGTAFSEPRLLALGYAFEQITHARRNPTTTPPLTGETVQTSR